MKRIFLVLMLAAVSMLCRAAEVEEPSRIPTKFKWGADVGASVDMSGNDMTAVDFSIGFGLSHGWLNLLGIGLGADIPMANSCRSFPLFVNFRTNFSNRPTLLFWDVRAGASFNYLEHNHKQTGIYGSTGLGFNLSQGAKSSSYIIIGYTYRQRRRIVGTEMTHDFTDLHYATVKIGISF